MFNFFKKITNYLGFGKKEEVVEPTVKVDTTEKAKKNATARKPKDKKKSPAKKKTVKSNEKNDKKVETEDIIVINAKEFRKGMSNKGKKTYFGRLINTYKKAKTTEAKKEAADKIENYIKNNS